MGEAMMERVYRGGEAKYQALLAVAKLASEGLEPSDMTIAAAEVAEPTAGAVRKNRSGNSARLIRGGPCQWCFVIWSPQWRHPQGTGLLLCNACGLSCSRAIENGITQEEARAARARPAAACADMPMDEGNLSHPSCSEQSQHYRPRRRAVRQQPTCPTLPLVSVGSRKRQGSPQLELELLQCTEEPAGSFAEESGAPATLAPLGWPGWALGPSLSGWGSPAPHLQLMAGGGVGLAAGMGARMVLAPTSTLLTVAPLNLGAQHVDDIQLYQMHGLGPLWQLAGLSPPRLEDSVTSPPCNAMVEGRAAAAGRLPGPSSVLAPELLGRPSTLQSGLLHSGVSLLAAPQLLMWPSKRQERPPTGDSEDSGASADSHAPTAHGALHDEQNGGTALAGSSMASARMAPWQGPFCSPPSPGLFLQPPALLALPRGGVLQPNVPSVTAGVLAFPSVAPGLLGSLPSGFATLDVLATAATQAAGGPGNEPHKAIWVFTRTCNGPSRGRVFRTITSLSIHS